MSGKEAAALAALEAVPVRRRRGGLWLLLALLLLVGAGFGAVRFTPQGQAAVAPLAGVPVLGRLLAGNAADPGGTSGAAPAAEPATASDAAGGGAGSVGDDAGAAGADPAVQALAEREALLRQREVQVADELAELNRRLSEVAALRAQLSTQVTSPRLADVVRAMPPTAAAQALQNLPDAEFVAVLQRLDAQAAADILAKVDPARAAQLMQAWQAPAAASNG